MLIILSNNPIVAANLVPDKIKFKQLLELCQMICSCGYSDVYKPIKQGKNIQEWIKKNPTWVACYAETLFSWCIKNINLKRETYNKFEKIIRHSMPISIFVSSITTAILRYVKGYECKYPTDTELPIEEAISIYNDYVHNFKRWES